MNTMKLVVPLSESEVVHVHSGQVASVTVEALEGAKLAAHVASLASTPASSSSGVVSYEVTFGLDQTASGLKPGMSASAEIVVKQEEGLNVPTSAITPANSVTVQRAGKPVRQRVVTGLAGDSSTIIHAGLREGEEVVLRVASSAASHAGFGFGSRSGGLGGGGLGGGLGGGGPPVRVGAPTP